MSLDPFLFSTRADVLPAAIGAGIGAVVVDWERKGKAERQAAAEQRIGTDTQIGADSADDLSRAKALCQPAGVPVICRINAVGPHTPNEVHEAIARGATEILVPMVRSVTQVEQVLGAARGDVDVSVMIETSDAVRCTARLAELPLARAYVGLMDLALDRGTPSIFTALVDGTVDRVRDTWPGPFGFGGLTLPGRGNPLPTELLLHEMVRLRASFTFLRRSFLLDTEGGDVGAGVGCIRRAVASAEALTAPERQLLHRELVERIREVDGKTQSA